MSQKFKTIGLFGKFKDSSVREAMNGLAEYLRYRNIGVVIGETTADDIIAEFAERFAPSADQALDLGIVIGGDGTMLHVASSLAESEIPVVGVNMGRLGFLTDIPLREMYEDIGRILDGEYTTEPRMMLDVEVWQDDKKLIAETAFNDIVIGKSETEKLIEVQTYIDGEFVMGSRSDGILVATPTGSTAYALSAGGPILHPQLEALILVPICPHTLTMRPIALKAGSVIDFTVVDIAQDSAHISLDGQIRCHLKGDEKTRVCRSRHTVNLIRTLENNYYAALRSKLGWGERV
jgi:NAD+ kinase